MAADRHYEHASYSLRGVARSTQTVRSLLETAVKALEATDETKTKLLGDGHCTGRGNDITGDRSVVAGSTKTRKTLRTRNDRCAQPDYTHRHEATRPLRDCGAIRETCRRNRSRL